VGDWGSVKGINQLNAKYSVSRMPLACFLIIPILTLFASSAHWLNDVWHTSGHAEAAIN